MKQQCCEQQHCCHYFYLLTLFTHKIAKLWQRKILLLKSPKQLLQAL